MVRLNVAVSHWEKGNARSEASTMVFCHHAQRASDSEFEGNLMAPAI